MKRILVYKHAILISEQMYLWGIHRDYIFYIVDID
jgi:hypothetical protein